MSLFIQISINVRRFSFWNIQKVRTSGSGDPFQAIEELVSRSSLNVTFQSDLDQLILEHPEISKIWTWRTAPNNRGINLQKLFKCHFSSRSRSAQFGASRRFQNLDLRSVRDAGPKQQATSSIRSCLRQRHQAQQKGRSNRTVHVFFAHFSV